MLEFDYPLYEQKIVCQRQDFFHKRRWNAKIYIMYSKSLLKAFRDQFNLTSASFMNF